mmetsp:Transcript_21606/g.46555  ORF Transcript_21606/g.46555 Transcript_21606/m.46555 type:complete len:277 (+) Transcript_21606:1285-2115(+)
MATSRSTFGTRTTPTDPRPPMNRSPPSPIAATPLTGGRPTSRPRYNPPPPLPSEPATPLLKRVHTNEGKSTTKVFPSRRCRGCSSTPSERSSKRRAVRPRIWTAGRSTALRMEPSLASSHPTAKCTPREEKPSLGSPARLERSRLGFPRRRPTGWWERLAQSRKHLPRLRRPVARPPAQPARNPPTPHPPWPQPSKHSATAVESTAAIFRRSTPASASPRSPCAPGESGSRRPLHQPFPADSHPPDPDDCRHRRSRRLHCPHTLFSLSQQPRRPLP